MQRWVIKAGSNMVCSGGPLLVLSWMQQLAELRRKHKVEVIWVTSGAIATAAGRLNFRKKKKHLSEKQALSAIGQPEVMNLYNTALQSVGLNGAQVLLTSDDLEDAVRAKNLSNTLEQLLEWKTVPVLNENDAVATEEIRFGDNDSLSAKVAACMGADRLVILTDVPGLYDSDPRGNKRAKLIPVLPKITEQTLSLAGRRAGSDRGTGGMYSKLMAARHASNHRVETWLVKGDIPRVLLEVAAGKRVGTQIKKRARK